MNWKIFVAVVVIIFPESISEKNTSDSDKTAVVEEKAHFAPFYWKPKLIISLRTPKPKLTITMIVILRGYKLAITTMALLEGVPERHWHAHLNPMKATFYTDAYRWLKRYLSLLPMWFYGEGGHYIETLQVWNKRFLYADTFMPSWLQRLLFFIPAEDWEIERNEFALFTRYAGDTYARQMRFNNATLEKPLPHWLLSHESNESMEAVPTTTLMPTTTEITSTTEPFEYTSTTVSPVIEIPYAHEDDSVAPWNWTWGASRIQTTTEKIWYIKHAPWMWDWAKPKETIKTPVPKDEPNPDKESEPKVEPNPDEEPEPKDKSSPDEESEPKNEPKPDEEPEPKNEPKPDEEPEPKDNPSPDEAPER